MEQIVILPEHLDEVEGVLSTADWIVHNFDLAEGQDVYSLMGFWKGKHVDGFSYRASIDRNIIKLALECFAGKPPNNERLTACALFLFFLWAEIEVDSTIAVYERYNYDHGDIEKALDEISLIRAVIEADEESLVNFLKGDSRSLAALKPWPIDRVFYKTEITRYHRLIDWNSEYLLILALVDIRFDRKIQPREKFEMFLEWVVLNYRMSNPVLVLAALVFGKDQPGNLMKFNPELTPQRKLAEVRNMTWDIYYLRQYLNRWTERSKVPSNHDEEFFVTQDKGLRTLFRTVISLVAEGSGSSSESEAFDRTLSGSVLPKHLRPRELEALRVCMKEKDSRTDRVYETPRWTMSYREELIGELERKLGIRES